MTLRVLDLFSGIGGFSLGLERTGGFKTVAFCEIEPFCRKVLAKHWPEVPICHDIRTMETYRATEGAGGGFVRVRPITWENCGPIRSEPSINVGRTPPADPDAESPLGATPERTEHNPKEKTRGASTLPESRSANYASSDGGRPQAGRDVSSMWGAGQGHRSHNTSSLRRPNGAGESSTVMPALPSRKVTAGQEGSLDGCLVGPIDVICGGFPCTDISVAGKGAGIDGAQSGLWSEYARIIGEVRPLFVIVENVSALLSRGLDRVLGDLASLGFDAEWHCIPASAVGAPHRRDRIWIVANPNGGRALVQRGNGGRDDLQRHETPSLQERKNLKFGTVGSGSFVDANGQWQPQSQGRERDERGWIGSSGHNVSNASGAKCFGLLASRLEQKLAATRCNSWWFPESDVCRVANGVPSRVDRLKGLGNAVVPQIPELIGNAILASLKQADAA